jgi:hypothetical protein
MLCMTVSALARLAARQYKFVQAYSVHLLLVIVEDVSYVGVLQKAPGRFTVNVGPCTWLWHTQTSAADTRSMQILCTHVHNVGGTLLRCGSALKPSTLVASDHSQTTGLILCL